MTRLCGRFGWDLERVWTTVTPGELEAMVRGGSEAERLHRYGYASIVAVVMSALGRATSPEEVLGEATDFGESPFPQDDPRAVYERKLKRERERDEERMREWLPPGFVGEE